MSDPGEAEPYPHEKIEAERVQRAQEAFRDAEVGEGHDYEPDYEGEQ